MKLIVISHASKQFFYLYLDYTKINKNTDQLIGQRIPRLQALNKFFYL